METCEVCGHVKKGRECPNCHTNREQAKRDQERQAHAERMQEESIEAALRRDQLEREFEDLQAEQRREDEANAWRYQAASKCERAEQLLAAGIPDRAFDLLQDSLRQDPSSIRTYLAMCQVCAELGNRPLLRECSNNVVRLLFSLSSCDACPFYRRAIHLIRDQDLIEDALRQMRASCGSWPIDKMYYGLISELIERGHLQDAGVLVDSALSQNPTLVNYAAKMIIQAPSDQEVIRTALRGYLGNIRPEIRSSVLDQYRKVASPTAFETEFCLKVPHEVIQVIKSVLKDAYRSWEAAISAELQKTAEGRRTWTRSPVGYGWFTFGLTLGGSWILNSDIGFLAILTGVVLGGIVFQVMKRSIQSQQVATAYQSLCESERKDWSVVNT